MADARDTKDEADQAVHRAALAYAQRVRQGDPLREAWQALLAAVEARRQLYEI